MTIFEKDNFRIQTISRLSADGVDSLPISEGLAIERTNDGGESYFVVGFVKFEKDEEKYEDVCFRTFDIDQDDWDLFTDLVSVARSLVIIANK